MSRRKSPARRFVVLVLLALMGYAGVVWAEDMRCQNCGVCSSSELMCGLCIVEALRHDCGTYGPNAYCTCDNNVWDCFCDRID